VSTGNFIFCVKFCLHSILQYLQDLSVFWLYGIVLWYSIDLGLSAKHCKANIEKHPKYRTLGVKGEYVKASSRLRSCGGIATPDYKSGPFDWTGEILANFLIDSKLYHTCGSSSTLGKDLMCIPMTTPSILRNFLVEWNWLLTQHNSFNVDFCKGLRTSTLCHPTSGLKDFCFC